MAQLNSIITFADSGANEDVNAARLNSHVNDAVLLNGAVISQIEQTTPLAADTLLLGDSTAAANGVPKKVQIGNLLLQAQRDGTQRWGGTASGTNTLTVTTSPVSSGVYVTGEIVRFLTSAANTGAVTINIDGRGTKNLYNSTPAPLVSGDLPLGTLVEAVYDGTQFQIVGFALRPGVVTATQATENFRQSINQYAADSGSANAYVVAPSPAATAYTAGMVVRFKAANANTTASTVNVNGLGAKTIAKNGATALAAGDIAANEVVTVVYDGTNFQLAGRATSLGFTWNFTSSVQAIPAASSVLTVAHSLGALPSKVRVVLVQNTASAQSGWAQNDELDATALTNSNNNRYTIITGADATNITVARSDAAGTLQIIPKAGGAPAAITEANWKLKIYASL